MLDLIEEQLLAAGGLLTPYGGVGTKLFRTLQEAALNGKAKNSKTASILQENQGSELEW